MVAGTGNIDSVFSIIYALSALFVRASLSSGQERVGKTFARIREQNPLSSGTGSMGFGRNLSGRGGADELFIDGTGYGQ